MHPKIVKYIDKHMGNAMKGNVTRICKMLGNNPEALLVDLGCDDGRISMEFIEAVGTTNVHGVEYSETERTRLACEKGIKIRFADLNIEIPFDDYIIDEEKYHEIIEKHAKKLKPKWRKQQLRDTIALGCSPKCDNRNYDKLKHLFR